VLGISALLLGVRSLGEESGKAVAWQDLTSQVGPLKIVRSERRLFRERAELVEYLAEAKASRAAPAVDFSTRQLLLLSPGPRSGTGYSVEVLSAREHGAEITVHVRERAPTIGEQVEPRVTYPYRLISLPARKDVEVDWLGR
jgi:hypothetical protein